MDFVSSIQRDLAAVCVVVGVGWGVCGRGDGTSLLVFSFLSMPKV